MTKRRTKGKRWGGRWRRSEESFFFSGSGGSGGGLVRGKAEGASRIGESRALKGASAAIEAVVVVVPVLIDVGKWRSERGQWTGRGATSAARKGLRRLGTEERSQWHDDRSSSHSRYCILLMSQFQRSREWC